MRNIYDNSSEAAPGRRAPVVASKNPRTNRLRTSLMVACALLGGVLGGTGGFALAAGNWHHGPRLAMIQQMALHALDGVGASSAQEDKIHDIIAKTFGDLTADPAQRQAMRKQVLDLLRAPTIDRGAVEKLRANQVAQFDAKSKLVVGALLDSADQLTADQRAKLAERFEAMAQRHRDGGRPGGGWTNGPDRDQMDRDQGPDGGPAHDPSKG